MIFLFFFPIIIQENKPNIQIEITHVFVKNNDIELCLNITNSGTLPQVIVKPNQILATIQLERLKDKKRFTYLFQGKIFDMSNIDLNCQNSIALYSGESFSKQMLLAGCDFSPNLSNDKYTLMIVLDYSKYSFSAKDCAVEVFDKRILSNGVFISYE